MTHLVKARASLAVVLFLLLRGTLGWRVNPTLNLPLVVVVVLAFLLRGVLMRVVRHPWRASRVGVGASLSSTVGLWAAHRVGGLAKPARLVLRLLLNVAAGHMLLRFFVPRLFGFFFLRALVAYELGVLAVQATILVRILF
jgi:F0F1-type ATP synthase membrane subunit a